MSSRSCGLITVSVGLINIKLKLYLTAKSEQVSFNQINSQTKNRINQKTFDVVTGDEVPHSNIIRGFEYASGQYALFNDKEFKELQSEKLDIFNVYEFVPTSEIDYVQIEKSFYLQPDKGMEYEYIILYKTLVETNMAAVGLLSSSNKEHLVIIRPYKNGLILHHMFYKNEMREFESVDENTTITNKELTLFKKLIKQLSNNKLDIDAYYDGFPELLNKAIEQKIKDKNTIEDSSIYNFAENLEESVKISKAI